MLTEMQKFQRLVALRPDLSFQDRKDRRRCRYLSLPMEEQRQRVMRALGPSHLLTLRMRECGKVDEWDNMKLCGIPTCPRCFLNRRGQQTAQAIGKTFKDIPNERLGFLTLLIPDLPAHIWEVSEIIREAELKLRNFIIRARRQDPRWDAVHLVGYWELDRIEVGEIPRLGRNKQRFFNQSRIPKGLDPDVTLWVPHFHAVVALGDVSREEFADRLRVYGHGASHQVDLQGFHEQRRVKENLSKVIRYANKFRIEGSYKSKGGPFAADVDLGNKEERSWWPDADIKALTEWLCLDQKGFQSLRFLVGSKKQKRAVQMSELRMDQGSSNSLSSVIRKNVRVAITSSVRARYNKPLQDTIWPTQRHRRKPIPASALDLTPHPLFIFSVPLTSPEFPVADKAWPIPVIRSPPPQIGSVLLSARERWCQRAS